MNQLVSGGIIVGYVVCGLFFLRFWRQTSDRLFLLFSAAFWILGVQRVMLALTTQTLENQAPLFTVRLAAFVIILWAILDRNRRSEPRGPRTRVVLKERAGVSASAPGPMP